jgi:protease IV
MSNSNQTSSRPDPPHVQLPQEIVIRQRTSGLGRSLATLGWIGFLFCLALLVATQREPSDGVEEKFHSGERTARNKIAIISVEGTIIDGEGFVKRQIDRVRDDDRVKGVVVRINSPGGTVYGSDHIHHQLRRLREEKEIPMVVSMGGVAASGGYYVAMAAGDQERSLFAEPITTTGSIGVLGQSSSRAPRTAASRVKRCAGSVATPRQPWS